MKFSTDEQGSHHGGSPTRVGGAPSPRASEILSLRRAKQPGSTPMLSPAGGLPARR
jgi:hypothetical protein